MKLDQVVVTNSNIGLGIFSTSGFKIGDKVFELKGKLIYGDDLYKYEKKFRDNTYRISQDYYISPKGLIGDFLNHSCKPNVGLKKIRNKFYLCAIKNIKPNEEVLLDYSTIIADDDYWYMKCKCGMKNCRGTIKRFKFLPDKLKKFYRSLGIVQDFISPN